jgi:hypothetical protein
MWTTSNTLEQPSGSLAWANTCLENAGFTGNSMSGDALHKTRELIVNLAERSADDAHFGRTKLAKLLFLCDFGAYAEFGEPITGACYRKRPHGPLAEEELLALRDLTDSGSVKVEEISVGGYTQKRVTAERSADISWMTPAQHGLIDQILDRHRNDHATELSNLSHDFPGWALAQMNEEIPYYTVFSSRTPPAQEDIDWGLAVVRELQEA